MAKHPFGSVIAVRRPAPIMMPRPRRYFAKRAGRAIARGARRAAPHAKRHVPAMSLAIGGLLVGWMDAKGYLNKIPTIGNSRALTLGIAGYAATRFFPKYPMVQNAGLAALAAAAFDFGKVHASKGLPKVAVKGESEGEGAGAHDDFSSSRGDGGPY